MSSSYSSTDSDSGYNYYTPDTPSGNWQQYRCRSCDLPKRVAVSPSGAEMTIRTGCERCESRTKHRADGGSGKLPMIDLSKNVDISSAAALGGLRAGRSVRTSILDDETSEHIHLGKGDDICSSCESQILLTDFGENAPIELLAHQKRKRGETHCESCLSGLEVTTSE